MTARRFWPPHCAGARKASTAAGTWRRPLTTCGRACGRNCAACLWRNRSFEVGLLAVVACGVLWVAQDTLGPVLLAAVVVARFSNGIYHNVKYRESVLSINICISWDGDESNSILQGPCIFYCPIYCYVITF